MGSESMTKGWKLESARHSLAAKKIKTGRKAKQKTNKNDDTHYTKVFENLDYLKREGKALGFKILSVGGVVGLFPKESYVKQYGEGDYNKASADLAEWYGLFGVIDKKGRVLMRVRKEGCD